MDMDGRNVQSEIEDHDTQLNRIVEDKLETVLDISEHCCIFRVPKLLRDKNEAAYVPRLVSLGPFHHGNENLKAMEEHKWRCFKSFIKKHQIDLDALLGLMKKDEEKTRGFYADHIALPSDQFVQVILVDAIFVINFLLQVYSPASAVDVGSIYHDDFFMREVSRDMMLLENQLPLFILNKILHFAKRTDGTGITEQRSVIELSEYLFTRDVKEEESITKLCHGLFNLNSTDHESDKEDLKSYNNARHLVDFQRLLFMPVEAMSEARCNGKFERIKSVSKLHMAGVRFELASAKTLLDIKFKDGVLEIPGIVVSGWTETIFRNLLAYDQCHHGCLYVNNYFVLMGMLIDTADDVELLVKNNILQNDMATEEEVSKVFKRLEKEVFYEASFYYSHLCKQLNAFCHIAWMVSKKQSWMVELKQNYLGSPWKVISVIAASILIVLTMIQTVCSVISL